MRSRLQKRTGLDFFFLIFTFDIWQISPKLKEKLVLQTVQLAARIVELMSTLYFYVLVLLFNESWRLNCFHAVVHFLLAWECVIILLASLGWASLWLKIYTFKKVLTILVNCNFLDFFGLKTCPDIYT